MGCWFWIRRHNLTLHLTVKPECYICATLFLKNIWEYTPNIHFWLLLNRAHNKNGVLVQDSKALANLTSHCEARVLHMHHTSSQECQGIHSKCILLAIIEKGTQ